MAAILTRTLNRFTLSDVEEKTVFLLTQDDRDTHVLKRSWLQANFLFDNKRAVAHKIREPTVPTRVRSTPKKRKTSMRLELRGRDNKTLLTPSTRTEHNANTSPTLLLISAHSCVPLLFQQNNQGFCQHSRASPSRLILELVGAWRRDAKL
ncbi:hypothetical protein BDR05DRAFT_988279 [Suillus weaverae]|nr:hypothetical protein BDR05DRAFT_988279 [Suillus weaverae]